MRLLLLGLLTALPAAAADDRVALPENYRDTYVEYLSLDRTQNHDQFIRLLANPAALRGGDSLVDGSIIVGEVYSVRKDDDGDVITSALGRRIADELILIAVMEKRTGWAETSNSTIDVGDWDFGAFKPDGTDAGKALDDCRACHSPLAATDYLFSTEHLPATDD